MALVSTPFNLTNGSTADASQVMANFAALVAQLGGTGGVLTGSGNLDATNFAAAQAWQTIALSGASKVWQAPGTLAYYKDALGIVHLRGDLVTLTSTDGSAGSFGTLPAGYRPGTTIRLPVALVASGTFSMSGVDITTAGVLSMTVAYPVSAISFGSCHFRAEN